MRIVLLQYNSGNHRSVLFALERLGVQASISDDPETIRAADKVIFPGVGEASSAMKFLSERKLDAVLRDLQQPVLGICLGMQLLCAYSEEGDTPGIGIFPQRVKKISSTDAQLKIPQMGWNTIANLRSPLFAGLPEQSYVYFVHSYYAESGAYTIAETDYGLPYSAALQKNNFYACQFHPEKSGAAGEQILKNFLAL